MLFPVVGKLKGGHTVINGRTFEIPQHGFARDLKFEPITKLDNFHSYKLVSDKYTLVRYPFEFELYNTYRQEENKLIFIYKVINTGDSPMTFGLGSHPAFKIDSDDIKKENWDICDEDGVAWFIGLYCKTYTKIFPSESFTKIFIDCFKEYFKNK